MHGHQINQSKLRFAEVPIDDSFDEDFGPKDLLNGGGGYRSVNHFYDPLAATPQGLSEIPLWPFKVQQGRNSFDWATVSNRVGVDISYNKSTKNIWSWQNARGYQWAGLTATNQLERQDNLDKMFRSVGQVMHLLEDTTQPQHVRNEQNLS